MARPGGDSLLFWSRVSRILGPAGCVAAYMESGRGWVLLQRLGEEAARLEPSAGLFAAAAGGPGSVCASTTAGARNGSVVTVFAAVPGPLARGAYVTAQVPPQSRAAAPAVLARLVARLLEVYGVSYLRLAARLAVLGGGAAAVLLLVHRRGYPAPLVYYASRGGYCVEAAGGGAVAAYPGDCRPGGVVLSARPRSGVVAVRVVRLEDALRG